MIDKADTYCGKCIKADVCGMEGVYDPSTTYCAYRVEERPHGEWEKKPICYDYFYCSECEYAYKHAFNFCPNCGADMRQKKGEAK